MTVKIGTIVEGHGECEAVPALIRRIARDLDPGFVPDVLSPVRVPASRLVKQGEIERSIEFVARKLGGQGGIIIILDCDSNGCCPALFGPELLKRARASRSDILISVILAKKEFEAWFIAAAESLSGKCGLEKNLQSPSHPENIRDAKGWLSQRMEQGLGYSETNNQTALTAIFDMTLSREKSDSFDKCYRDIKAILEHLRKQERI